MGRPVVHFEIGCKDSAKTQEFYKKLFDWKIEAMGPAAMIAAEAGGITGHITALGHEPHHYTIFYVDVDDVAAIWKRRNPSVEKCLCRRWRSPRALLPGCKIPRATRSDCGRRRNSRELVRRATENTRRDAPESLLVPVDKKQ